MFGSVTELNPTKQVASMCCRKRFLESTHRVRVQVVTDQYHSLGMSVTTSQGAVHFLRPIDFRSTLPNRHFSPTARAVQ